MLQRTFCVPGQCCGSLAGTLRLCRGGKGGHQINRLKRPQTTLVDVKPLGVFGCIQVLFGYVFQACNLLNHVEPEMEWYLKTLSRLRRCSSFSTADTSTTLLRCKPQRFSKLVKDV